MIQSAALLRTCLRRVEADYLAGGLFSDRLAHASARVGDAAAYWYPAPLERCSKPARRRHACRASAYPVVLWVGVGELRARSAFALFPRPEGAYARGARVPRARVARWQKRRSTSAAIACSPAPGIEVAQCTACDSCDDVQRTTGRAAPRRSAAVRSGSVRLRSRRGLDDRLTADERDARCDDRDFARPRPSHRTRRRQSRALQTAAHESHAYEVDVQAALQRRGRHHQRARPLALGQNARTAEPPP